MSEAETSKNALKKQKKAEEAAAKKAAKDAEKAKKAAENPVVKKADASAEESEELDPTQYYENRMAAIRALEVNKLNIVVIFNCIFYTLDHDCLSFSF